MESIPGLLKRLQIRAQLLQAYVNFVLSWPLLSTLMLPGFCCCWRVACIFAVDCLPSVSGTVADDPFLLAAIDVSADAAAPAVAGVTHCF